MMESEDTSKDLVKLFELLDNYEFFLNDLFYVENPKLDNDTLIFQDGSENNYDKMQNSQQNEQDIEKTTRSAVQMSKLVKENKYDESVLNRYL